jgi:hypothetical protein
MGAPVGNQNGAKKNRMLTDALRRELVQNPEDALAVARKTIDAAKAGEAWAQNLIYDRIDGKVPQPVVGDDESPPINLLAEVVTRGIKPADSGLPGQSAGRADSGDNA